MPSTPEIRNISKAMCFQTAQHALSRVIHGPGHGESTAKAPENLKFSCSEAAVCAAELQPCHVLCDELRGRLLTSESFPCCGPPSVSRNELSLSVLDQGTKKLLYFHCLQMGHAWRSELESPIESENSDFQSLPDWDSSLDLDVTSWRNTEEEAMGKIEGSSPEADHEMELSEPLWKNDSEDNHEAEKPCESDSLFQFLLEVGLFGLQEGGQHSSGSPETLEFSGPAPPIPTETV